MQEKATSFSNSHYDLETLLMQGRGVSF